MVNEVSLALLLTPGGGVIAAAVVRQLVEVVKVALPSIDRKVSGALQATIAAAVIYILAWASAGVMTTEAAFVAFLGWLGCSASAIGINSAIDHVARVTRSRPPEGTYIPRTDGQL